MAEPPVNDPQASEQPQASEAASPTRGTVRSEDHLLGLDGNTPARRRRPRPVITLSEPQVQRELRLVRVTALLAAIWGAWTVIAAFLVFADEMLHMRIAESWLPTGLVEAIEPTGLTILVSVLSLTGGALYLWGALRLMRLDRVARWVLMGLAWLLLLNIGSRLLAGAPSPEWEILSWEIAMAVATLALLQRRPMAELMILAALTRRRIALEAAVKLARKETSPPTEISDHTTLVEALMQTAERYRPAPEAPKRGFAAAIAAARAAAQQQGRGAAGDQAAEGAGLDAGTLPPPGYAPSKAPQEPSLVAEDIPSVTPYPLLVESRLIPTAWGGTGLRQLGEEIPEGERIGYAQHLAPGVRIRNGALAGHTLETAARHWGPWLLGPPALEEESPGLPIEVAFLATARSTPVLAIPPHEEERRELVIAWLLLQGPGDALIRSGIVRPGVDGVVAHPVKPGEIVHGYLGEPYTIGPNLLCYQLRLAGPEPSEVKPAELEPLSEPEPRSSVGKPLTIEGVEQETLVGEGPLRLHRLVLNEANETATLTGERLVAVHHLGGRAVRLDWPGGSEWLSYGKGVLLPAAVLYHGASLTAPQNHTNTQPATLVLAAPA